MAVVKYPSGSPGENRSYQGACFTKNSSGSIIRIKRKPLLKRTPATTQSRTNFRHVTTNYRINSPAEKTAWSDKTPQFPKTDSLGIPYSLSGLQLYQSLNNARVNEDLPVNFTAPDAAVFPSRSIISSLFDVDPIDLSLSLDVNTVPAGFNFRFYCTMVSFSELSLDFPQDYTFIQSFSPGAYALFDVTIAYNNILGPGPAIIPGASKNWYLSTVLQAFFIDSGETKELSTFFSTIFQ